VTARKLILAFAACWSSVSFAQVAPTLSEQATYKGLLAAAAQGDVVQIRSVLATGAAVDVRDRRGRTPLIVAAYLKRYEAMRSLVAAGANPDAMDNDRYDIVTIAAVANDARTLELALLLGCSPRNITSRYRGTALIAAAHLGNADIVRTLIRAGAPLDHVNNLGWTAVIESIVLGDGGGRHQDTLKALIQAGANLNIADLQGRTPLELAKERRYGAMYDMLTKAGAK
jgi:uncharacterized protein